MKSETAPEIDLVEAVITRIKYYSFKISLSENKRKQKECKNLKDTP